MTFDDIIRPQNPNPDQPVVTRIAPKPDPAPLSPCRPSVEEERVPADVEPHFPRIFPGI
ncbi:MAG TPA: hypothetical protein VFW46_17855 [Stellaceae bacterium]|jgi:hypothetical protein|nr:hypothetical protein [Stellaceae bacterium]